MPDPGMPYYDPTQNQFGMIPQQQPMQYNPPDSNLGYNTYIANNQMLLNQSSQFQQTMQIAQNNFHQHMQTVLQGTMAAAMSLYNTGKSAVDKSREHIYQDMLVGQAGNYVLERSFMREAVWGLGIGGSDLGRALKIGGRKPEFVSQEELEFQMSRAWGHRKSEALFALGGGAASVGGSILGMGIGGWKALPLGMAIDFAVNPIYQTLIAPARNRLEFRKFSETTDLNQGYTQRRLSESVSDRLADRFYAEDELPLLRALPIIGNILADRLSPETKRGEFRNKMMSAGLFRDTDINDVDAMERQVRSTIKVVEKYAGLAHTTKEAILSLKATFNKYGLNDAGQNQAIANLTATSISTGLDLGTLASQTMAPAMQMAIGYGYNKDIVAARSLKDVGSLKAMQEAGLLDYMYDPATLAAQNLNNALNYGRSGPGKIARFGGRDSDIRTAREYFTQIGRGNAAVGYAVEGLPGYIANDDPIETYRKGVINTVAKLGGGFKGLAATISALGKTREEKIQIYNAYYGLDVIGEAASAASVELKRAQDTNDYSKLRSFDTSKIGTFGNVSAQAVETDPKYKLFNSLNKDLYSKLFGSRISELRELRSSNFENYQIRRFTLKSLIKSGYNLNDSEADSFIDKALDGDSNVLDIDPSKGYATDRALLATRENRATNWLDRLLGKTEQGGFRNTKNEDYYKLSGELFSQNPEFLEKAKVIISTYGKNNSTIPMEELYREAYNANLLTGKAFNILTATTPTALPYDAVLEAISNTQDTANISAMQNLYKSLSAKDPITYADTDEAKQIYQNRVIEYGRATRDFQKILQTKDRTKIQDWLTFYNKDRKMENEATYLGSATGGLWKALSDLAFSGGSIEEMTLRSKDLHKILAKTDAEGNPIAPGAVDPNTQMIQAFTKALDKISESLK